MFEINIGSNLTSYSFPKMNVPAESEATGERQMMPLISLGGSTSDEK